MKNFLSSLLATLTGLVIMLVVLFIIFLGIVSASSSNDAPDVKPNSLLYIQLKDNILDRANEDPIAALMSSYGYEDNMGLNQVLKDLDKAAKDDNIEGVFLRLRSVSAGMATLGEIRKALVDFKESGKFIYAYSDSYTQKSYYLASVADSVFMAPQGMFPFIGMSAQVNYYKDALDKAGVEMQIFRHGSYKGAVEPFMRNDMSPENREQIESYVGGLWGKIMEDISESRGISVEELNRIADSMESIDPGKLMKTGLMDGLIYYDEMLSLLKEKMGVEEENDLESISLKAYKDVVVKTDEKKYSKDKVAVIYAMGSVVDGNQGEGYISSERISKAIREARRDKNVKAIVFRVNSGGGSGQASDIILREVKLAAEVKPVIASMGDVAASGGYYIAAHADTIMASESTITGSIGVFGMFPNLEGLVSDKIGVRTEVVKTNELSDIMSIMRPATAAEGAIIQKNIDDFYTTFVELVSDGRDMSYEEVDAVAGGRVWPGNLAKEIGLVDVHGGLEDAVELAAEMAGLENYRVKELPAMDDFMTSLMKQLSGGSMARAEALMKKELGESYKHYSRIRELSSMSGIQAIMPYEIEIR